MRSTRVLIIMVVAMALAACSSDKRNNDVDTPAPGTSTFLASGGTSTSGTGGTGGYVNVQSYGTIKVLRSDTVNASSIPSVALPAPSFGTNPYIVSSGTMTVLLDTDESGVLCTFYGDANLYIGDGDGSCDSINDTMVTGLTIDAGATLVLVDQGYWGGYGTLWLSNDLVVNGTITSTAPSVYIEANMIDVQSAGKIVTSATATDTSAGSIYLGCGDYGCGGNSFTNQIINRGSIEAKGLGNGSGGYIFFEPNDLVANYGAIDASGGDSDVGSGLSGGSGGELDVYVDYGDFYSSGIVRMNGGKGDTDGGDSEAEWCNYNCYSVYVETAYVDNPAGKKGDIIISGTWEANGGDGSGSDGVNGRGGYGGWIYLQTDAMGAVIINATMSAKGGNALAGGFPGGNAYYSYGIDIYSYNNRTDPATPGKISIAGKYDLRGGNGDESGGYGGYLYIYSNGYNLSNKGSDVELVGFPTLILNGGDGANGGSASWSAFQLYSYTAGGITPGGTITNEANIEAMGGRATDAVGTGGNGGNIIMSSDTPPTVNTGTLSVAGGTGATAGNPGTKTIDGVVIP